MWLGLKADVRRPLRSVCDGKHAPGSHRVVTYHQLSDLRPIGAAVVGFGCCEHRIVAVDVDLVRIDAHPKLGVEFAGDIARLEPDGQKQDGNRCRHRRR